MLVIVPLRWCWQKKQALLGCLYLNSIFVVIGVVFDTVGYLQGVRAINVVIVVIAIAAVPLEIGVWVYRLAHKGTKEPEAETETQAKWAYWDSPTLVINEEGVYVPRDTK